MGGFVRITGRLLQGFQTLQTCAAPSTCGANSASFRLLTSTLLLPVCFLAMGSGTERKLKKAEVNLEVLELQDSGSKFFLFVGRVLVILNMKDQSR